VLTTAATALCSRMRARTCRHIAVPMPRPACRHEGIAESPYYAWSKEFLEAGGFSDLA